MSLKFCHAALFLFLPVFLTGMVSLEAIAQAQLQLPYTEPDRNSTFTELDFGEMYVNQENWEAAERVHRSVLDQQLVTSDTVSALDLQAPSKAVKMFNRGVALLRSQNSKNAIRPLQKAISIYPSFVSAHVALGYAYISMSTTVVRKTNSKPPVFWMTNFR
ncbi:MAG TPA: hypothetical protein VGS27_35180 [Candidatus Sulfotelmatobacter sp.]|nr:hypothetical protein [Candidatus Sulfotelmatobacter sp.]